jgi:hypothetical protein
VGGEGVTIQTRSAATGEHAELLTEARQRLEAVATALAGTILGELRPEQVATDSLLKLVDQGIVFIDRATE